MDFLHELHLETVDGHLRAVNADGMVLAQRPDDADAGKRVIWLMECVRDRSFEAATLTLTIAEMAEIAKYLRHPTSSFRNREEACSGILPVIKQRNVQMLANLRPEGREKLLKADTDRAHERRFRHLMAKAIPITELCEILGLPGHAIEMAKMHDESLEDIRCGRGSLSGVYALTFLQGRSPDDVVRLAKSGVITVRDAADRVEQMVVETTGCHGSVTAIRKLCDRLDAERADTPAAGPSKF